MTLKGCLRYKQLQTALLALFSGPALATGGPSFQALLNTPAVRLAYEGPATPEKLQAAMAGLRPLRVELPLITPPGPCWFCGSGSFTITGPGLVDIPYHVIGPLPDLLFAGSDADLGPPGATVTLAHTRLQLTGSFRHEP